MRVKAWLKLYLLGRYIQLRIQQRNALNQHLWLWTDVVIYILPEKLTGLNRKLKYYCTWTLITRAFSIDNKQCFRNKIALYFYLACMHLWKIAVAWQLQMLSVRRENIEAIRVQYVINCRFSIGKTCAHVYVINFHARACLIPFLNSQLTSYLYFYYSQTFGPCYPQRKLAIFENTRRIF